MTVVSLSPRSLRNIQSSQVEKTFTFFVGDENHHCHWFVAECLSLIISQLRQSDPTLDSYQVQTPNCSDIFAQFLSIGYGEDVAVTESTRDVFVSLCVELGNEDVYSQILDVVELTCDNVLSRLKMKRVCGCDFSKELEFAASHLYSISREAVEVLDAEDLSNILTNESLRLESEDWLYEVVASFVRQHSDDFWLFEYVRFEYLRGESISSFAELSENHLSSLNLSIWRAICGRLLQSACKVGTSDRLAYEEVEFRSSSPLDGIMSHLTREHQGNVHDVGVVNVTASSEYSSSHTPRNAVDMTDTCSFGTRNEANGWLCYDFADSRVQPRHYSIRSWQQAWAKGVDLVSWVIEISNDGETWKEVDRHDNDRTFLDGAVGSFAVSTPCGPSRFVRLRHTGKTARGTWDHLVVTSFELFGHLSTRRK
jgi:hypothetical protein